MRLYDYMNIMSSHSDEAISSSCSLSESFWEPGNYKRTTKRIEDGSRLCGDLVLLVQERCDIEKAYAKNLSNWSKRWNEIISKGPEYGTTEAAWKAVMNEADRLSDLHIRIKDKLQEQVISQIKQWQKEKFRKTLMPMQIREKKELDEEFKRVQKPWAKALERVNKTKHDYHIACKNERTLLNQERNASSDSSISSDQLHKIQERLAKIRDDVTKCKEKYEASLEAIGQINEKYVNDMTMVFEKCQGMEEERLKFFKDVLFNIHDCLNISKDPELPLIYEEFRHRLQNSDPSKDLKWWSNTYGIGMSMLYPQFEVFSEEFRDIIKDLKTKKVHASSDGITLINQHRFNEELPEWSESFAPIDNQTLPHAEHNNNAEQNGVAVRALYDYEGAEADELSFKQGDVFEKLEDEDEQGWCKGRKDDVVGLYPANYVEAFIEKEQGDSNT